MTFSQEQQEAYIRLAKEQAEASIAAGGSPFGAVLVDENGVVVAATRNTVTPQTDILRHAEVNLLQLANEKTGKQQFPNHAIFINAASCAMCAAAVIQSGIRDIYFGAPFESHTNPALSYEQIAPFCKQPLNINRGILEVECTAQIARGRGVK